MNLTKGYESFRIGRVIGILLACLMLLPMASVKVYATDGDILTGWTDEGYQMRIRVISEVDKTAEVYGNLDRRGNITYIVPAISGDIAGVITVPAQTEGYKIVSLGRYAFSGCDKVTEVKLPEGLQSIGPDAFSQCSRLETISIPSTVTKISNSMTFWFCSGLKSISVADGNTRFDSRDNCNAIIQKEGNVLILGCANSTIPEGVEEIGTEAFCGASGLTSVELPASLKVIGSEAFRGTGLTSITIPSGVESIGEWSFHDCEGLASVSLGEGVRSIGKGAFNGCYSLADINIHNNIEYIGSEAFSYCKKLPNFNLPSKLTKIKDYTFRGCNSLTEVYIHNNVDSIGLLAFGECESLEKITFGKGLTTIESGAFSQCDNIKSVVCFQDTPLDMRGDVFYSPTYKNAALSVPRGSRKQYAAAMPWSNFQRIVEFDPVAQISVATSADGLGSLAISGIYDLGSQVKLSASSESGWIFKGWFADGQELSAEKDFTITVSEDMSVVAKFEKASSGISNTRSESATPVAYYSLDGKQTDVPRVGVNIVRMSDGTARKVFVK